MTMPRSFSKFPVLRTLLLYILSITFASAQSTEVGEKFPEQAELFAQKCFQCHLIGEGEHVGPDLLGVTRRREHDWLMGYIQNAPEYHESEPLAIELFAEFAGLQMPDIEIEDEEIEGLLTYIEAHDRDVFAKARAESRPPPLPSQPARRGAVANISLVALLAALALVGLLLRIGRRNPAKIIAAASLGIGYLAFGGSANHHLPEIDQGYSPAQPIDFSHRLHAGDLEISCFYCHPGAEKSPTAGVPAVGTCMNCHRVVRSAEDRLEPSPEIAKLVAAWQTRESEDPESIAWTRVHNLPDYVRFDHRVHVGAGVDCQSCHGPVERMDQMRQVSTLSMGMCIECHRRGREEEPAHWNRVGGNLDCSACHF